MNLQIAYNESQHDVVGRQKRRRRGICAQGLTRATWRRTALRSVGLPPHASLQETTLPYAVWCQSHIGCPISNAHPDAVTGHQEIVGDWESRQGQLFIYSET